MKPDWKDAPEWAEYLAVDADGQWWWYQCEPLMDDSGWDYCNGDCARAYYKNVDYTKSLEQRPHNDTKE